MNRVLVAFGALVACVTTGCGASRSAESSPKQPAPEAAAPAPAAKDVSSETSTAGAAAAPALQGAPGPSSTRTDSARGAPSEMDVWGRQLDDALTLSTPDCATGWMLRDRLCDLAQRICDIAGRSAEPEVVERCSDGRARCDRATARVHAACPE